MLCLRPLRLDLRLTMSEATRNDADDMVSGNRSPDLLLRSLIRDTEARGRLAQDGRGGARYRRDESERL